MKRLLNSGSRNKSQLPDKDLDKEFYGKVYYDLAKMDDTALEKHWRLHGRSEKRFPSLKRLAQSLGVDVSYFDEFCPDFYLDYYSDVVSLCEGSSIPAYKHYVDAGKAEGRLASFATFLRNNHLDHFIARKDLNPASVFSFNKKKGVHLSYKNLMDMLQMEQPTKIALSEENEIDADFYIQLGKHYETSGQEEKARSAYLISCMLSKNGQALELIGNYYYRRKNFLTSIQYYKAALNNGASGRWIFEHLSECYFQKEDYASAFDVLVQGKAHFQEVLLFDELIDMKVKQFWQRRQTIHDAYALMQDRESLLRVVGEDVNTINGVYTSMYRTYGEPLAKVKQNKKRILIVGDFFLPQCIRYRIDQKIEQLESAGYECDTIDWIKVSEDHSKFAFYDFVIFYRTPAVPEIVKAMTYCNYMGKVVVYEIDDMVFDREYPIDIESYGGYVSLDQYKDLTKGMALFNSAMKLADFGLASTLPLQEKISRFVPSGICYVHRNGFDSKNYSQTEDKRPQKGKVDLFYGSGTKAHNSDFIEEALPAIVRLLDEYPDLRLVVAGYLNLPEAINKKYASQIRFLPFVSSVEAYWSYLKQADINIAVLSSDIINDGKSELKWFEAGYFSIPSVVSSTKNYRDVIDNGNDGIIADTPDAWYKGLKELIDSTDRRLEMGRVVKERVMQEYSIDKLASTLDASINDMLEKVN